MSKYIPIHPNDETFVSLMKTVAKALQTRNSKLLTKAKKEFADADISLFYNKEADTIKVLRKDCPPIDFPVSQFAEAKK